MNVIVEHAEELQRSATAAPQRLLVVDDEPGMIELIRAVFESSNLTVTGASTGAEALALLECGHYDLVLSDLYMPEMDGEMLYDRIRAAHPALAERMIFLSGDVDSARAQRLVEPIGKRWVHKPFDLAELEGLVNELLPGPTGPGMHG